MDWLSEQCRRIQEQKLKQERSIRHVKQLFKAWPKVKAEPEERKSDSQPNSNREKGSNQTQNEGERLTVEEKEGLLMMDKLLKKAEKARDLQKKLEEPKKPRCKQKNINDRDALKNDKITQENVDKESQRELSEVKNVSSNQTSKGPLQTTNHTNTASRSKAVSSIKPQDNRPNKAKPTEKVERQKISHRPQSSSGTRKLVPVHANAPFQTNPNLVSSRLQTTYKAATARTLAKSRSAGGSSSKARETKGNERAQTVASRCKSVKNDDKKIKPTNLQEVDKKGDSYVKTDTDIANCEESSVETNCIDDVEPLKEKLNTISMKSDQDSSGDKQSQASEDKNCEDLFYLKKDGANLSVPVRLKKLAYQNRKFRQKLYAQTVTQKVSSPDVTTDLPQNLQYAFGEEEDQQIQLQAKQAKHISSTYTSLLHMLDNLHLDHISADSDPADIYYCKKMVEHILLTFQELEQSLHTSDFSMLGNVVTPSDRPSIKLPLSQPSSMSVWYEKNMFTGKYCPPTVFQYGSYKLLEKYMDTVYQVQLLQLQIDVMDTVARLQIPLLQTLDPTSSEFAKVLRAGYSLVSINRNNQPVVVMDTIQDESTLQQED